MRYADMWPKYAAWWDAMIINASRMSEFTNEAKFAVTNKAEYVAVEAATKLPWAMIAVLHRRESNANFNTYLGNGQLLSRVTTIVPRGRGPFKDFVSGAIDAVKIEGWGDIQDWRLEKILYYSELFNGAGYYMHGIPSPYIWGGTNIQKPGKYVSDGVWSASTIDPQPGCAPLLATIMKLDATVVLTRES